MNVFIIICIISQIYAQNPLEEDSLRKIRGNGGSGPAHRCGKNEQYYECVTCDRTCKNPVVFCPVCTKPGCNCISGYVKDTTQTPPKCVPQDRPSCLAQREPDCGLNEIYYECSTEQCPRVCSNPNPICIEVCITPGNCDCKQGYLRESKTGKCINENCKACIKEKKSVNRNI